MPKPGRRLAFPLDINYLILGRGYSQGLHFLKVRAAIFGDNVTDIVRIPVIFDRNYDWDDPGRCAS